MSRDTSTVQLRAVAGSSAVGKYRLLCELGRGGMANVYLAVTRGAAGVNKLVVLKALLPDLAAEPEALTMFMDEARLAAQLNHGNVVQTYEVGTEGDRHVIVMEYLEGQALANVLRRAGREGQPFPLGMHLRVIISVLEGLHYAHELRGYDGSPLALVHRDVSPQNIFITYDGRVKVLDFGIAKAASSTTHTAVGVVKGKISYMSPEQMSAEPVDRRADVYSVGCMLWAAAAGQKLWKEATDAQVFRAVLEGAIPSPRSYNPSCDLELQRIVMKALAIKAEDRYSSALELHEDLERYCDQHDMQNRPRDLARFVATLFAETRAELSARVERGLRAVSPAVGLQIDQATDAPGWASSEQRSATSSTQTISASTVAAGTSSAPTARRRGALFLGVAVLGAALLLSYELVGRDESRAIVAKDVPAVAAPGTATQKLANVNLELRSNPSSARLFVDGEALSGNPARRVLPMDGKVHELRAEADGYRTASAQFAALDDGVVDLRLEKIEPGPALKSRPSGSARTGSLSKARPPANCAKPFFVDSDGIKKVRPGCL